MVCFSAAVSVLLIVILSFSLSVLVRKRISDCLHTAIFAVIVVLYCFYCADLLRVGLITVIAAVLAVTVLMIRKLKRAGSQTFNDTFRKTFSPGLVIFLLAAVFCVVYTKNYKVILWDEERLWGAVPKAMHETGRLQTGSQALIFEKMQSYPPGMMLFGYFITAFSGVFYENQLFAGYGLFSAALLVAGTGKIDRIQSRRKWLVVLPVTAAVVFLPCIFTSNGGDTCFFYLSLFIDPIMGILTGFLFYKAVNNPLKDHYETMDFALGLFVLTILKDSRIEFAVLTLLLAVIIWWISKKNVEVTIPKRSCDAAALVICAASVCMAYFSWRGILAHAGITNHIEFRLYRYGTEVWKRLWGYVSGSPVVSTRGMFGYKCPDVSLSLSTVMAICAGVGALRLILSHGKNLTAEIMARFFMVLAFVLFLYGYLCAFNDSVESMDKLPSFQRYMTTLAGCAVTFEFLGLLSIVPEISIEKIVKKVIGKSSEKKKKYLGFRKTMGVLGVLTGMAICVLCCRVMDVWSWNKYEDAELMQTVSETANFLKTETENNATGYGQNTDRKSSERQNPEEQNPVKICNLMTGSISENAMLHQRLYFDLLGSGIQIANYFQETRIAHVNPDEADNLDEAAVKECAEIWSNELKDSGYDYVYVLQKDSWTERIFHELDVELAPKNGVLYKVTENNYGSICLQRVSRNGA